MLLNEFFTTARDFITPYLVVIFNAIFNSGIFPEAWTTGLLVPLHKKGSIHSTDNYRGITLLSVLGKIFTRVLNNRLTKWAEDYGIYVEAQGGFRQGRGTTDNIFILYNIINTSINSGKTLYTAFIDFSKAFDYVVRDNLWYKLLKLGVNGKMLNILKSMYSHVKNKVFYKGNKSDSFESVLGVRQGDCLSPFLFAIYINDLEYSLNQCNTGIHFGNFKIVSLLYADDIILLSDSVQGLQNGLNCLYDFCDRWRLKLNIRKSKVVVFKKGQRNRHDKWFYGINELDIAKEMPYLGITFSNGGALTLAQKTLAKQASKATFTLYTHLYKFTHITPIIKYELFEKMVIPILNYASEVWGFHQGPDIEKVHLQFMKNIIGVKKSTQNNFLYGEFGQMPLFIRRKIQLIKYWLKIVSHLKSPYVYNLLLCSPRTNYYKDQNS